MPFADIGMANRDIRFDTGFENWLDNTLDKIRKDTKAKSHKGGLSEEGSNKKYSTFEDNTQDINSNVKEDSRSREGSFTSAQQQSNTFGPQTLADDLARFEYELIDEEWEEIATGAGTWGAMSKQREQVRQDDFQAGGQFYTTVWGLEDEDGGLGRKRDEYPQTPSARERVAKILQETELSDSQKPRREFKFDAVNYKAVKSSGEDVDSWSLEDEPPVTLDPSRLAYVHREAGDGKEQQPHNGETTYKLDNEMLDDNRNSQLSGSLDEFEDAQETLDDMGEGIDIKTPQGKGESMEHYLSRKTLRVHELLCSNLFHRQPFPLTPTSP